MLIIICLFVILTLLCAVTGKRFEQLLAPLISGMLLLCYGLSMFQVLQWCQWILLFAVMSLVAWLIYLRIAKGTQGFLRRGLRCFFTPGLLAFGLLLGLYVWAAQSHMVFDTDDIYYWSIEALSIFAHNGLVDASLHLSPRFMTYTPGMQLFQWIGLFIVGEWKESTLFLFLWIFYGVFMLPFCQSITWKKIYWLPLFLLLVLGLPTLWNNDSYSMLRVDTALGVCLGYAFLQAWQATRNKEDAPFHLGCFTLSLCVMVLVKQIGVLWMLMPISFVLLVRNPVKAGKTKGWQLGLACMLPLMFAGSWYLFAWVNQLTGTHMQTASQELSAMMSGTWKNAEPLGSTFYTLWKIFCGTERSMYLETTRWIQFPLIAWICLMIAIPLLLLWISRGHARTFSKVSLWIMLCFVAFFAGFILTSVVVFRQSVLLEDTLGFSFSLTMRYFCPFLLGVCGLLLGMCQEILFQCGIHSSAGIGARMVCLGLILLVLTCCNWPNVWQNLFTNEHGYPEDHYLYELRAENFWVESLESPKDTVLLYGTEFPPSVEERLQYTIAPAKLILPGREGYSQQQLITFLRSAHITHLVVMDENNPIYDAAVSLTEAEWLDVCTPYRVEWVEEMPWLVEE